ncbi:MAG TPA: hypothetical protein VH518_25290 [Tepidisphaeraceae bacterium]
MTPPTGQEASFADDSPATEPDWQTVSGEVLCPLCDYNLRGLVAARCPECGYTFDWIELIDRSRWEHPWLFEHRRKRRRRAFIHTFLVSLLPWKFWRSVQPIHRPIPRRLFIYWLIIAASLGLVLGALVVLPIAREYISEYASRKQMVYLLNNRPTDPRVAYILQVYRTPQAAAAAIAPMPPFEDIALRAGRDYRAMLNVLVPLSLVYLSWPWLTVFALMIFRDTMDQARIKPEHVVRCAIYSFDSVLLLGGALAVTSTWHPFGILGGGLWNLRYVLPLVAPDVLVVVLLGAILLTIKLSAAYRMYLRFPNAIATCVLAQLVVGLAILTVYMTIAMW